MEILQQCLRFQIIESTDEFDKVNFIKQKVVEMYQITVDYNQSLLELSDNYLTWKTRYKGLVIVHICSLR